MPPLFASIGGDWRCHQGVFPPWSGSVPESYRKWTPMNVNERLVSRSLRGWYPTRRCGITASAMGYSARDTRFDPFAAMKYNRFSVAR
jgi:hypothetical protein